MSTNTNEGRPVESASPASNDVPAVPTQATQKQIKISRKPYFNRESRTALAKKRSAVNKPDVPVSEELERKWAEIYDTTVPLARILRQRREELQLTQADVARALDIKSSEFIGMVENGQRRLDLNRLPALADVLKLDSEKLCRLALFEEAPQLALSLFGVKAETFVASVASGGQAESVPMTPQQVAHYQQLYALPSALRHTVLGLIDQFATLVREGPSRVRRLSGSK